MGSFVGFSGDNYWGYLEIGLFGEEDYWVEKEMRVWEIIGEFF